MFLREQLPRLRDQWGQPYHLWMTQEFQDFGWQLVQKTLSQDRSHDVTLFIQDPQGRFALMSKHSYPPGVFRSPSGGVKPGETCEAGALREAKEETGLDVTLQRFLLHITLDITHRDEVTRWESYIFDASGEGPDLPFTDHKEVKDARWATQDEMEEMDRRMIASGNGGLEYRGRLADAYLWALAHPLSIRPAAEKDLQRISESPAGDDERIGSIDGVKWWVAEVGGQYAGALALKARPECLELVGLNVESHFRGRGIGHALTEYVADQSRKESFLEAAGPDVANATSGGLWLLTKTPGYFMPTGFSFKAQEELPASFKAGLKPSPHYIPTAMKYEG